MHANGEAVEEEDSRMQFPNSNASIFIVGGGVRPHVRLSVIRRELGVSGCTRIRAPR